MLYEHQSGEEVLTSVVAGGEARVARDVFVSEVILLVFGVWR